MHDAGIVYAGLFERQVVGHEVIKTLLFDSLRRTIGNVFGRSIGEAVFDDTGTGITITASADPLNDRRLTFNGNLYAATQSGDSFSVGASIVDQMYSSGVYSCVSQDSAWFEDVPFENSNAVTYYAYVGGTKYPVDIGIGRDGGRGYHAWVDAPGITINPDSVVLAAGRVILLVDAALTTLDVAYWLTSHPNDPDWSMDCVVWLDTDVVGIDIMDDDPTIAIAFARLVKNPVGGAWMVDLQGIGDGNLGQSSPSATAAHYKIAVMGPLITTTATLKSSPDYVFLGTVTSGVVEVVSISDQPIVCSYASYAAGFAVEHNAIHGSPDLGLHKSITAPATSINLPISTNRPGATSIELKNVGGGSLRVDIYGRIFTTEGIFLLGAAQLFVIQVPATRLSSFMATAHDSLYATQSIEFVPGVPLGTPGHVKTVGLISPPTFLYADVDVPHGVDWTLNSLKMTLYSSTGDPLQEEVHVILYERAIDGLVYTILGNWKMGLPAIGTHDTVFPVSGTVLPLAVAAAPTDKMIRYWAISIQEPNAGQVWICGMIATAAVTKLSPP